MKGKSPYISAFSEGVRPTIPNATYDTTAGGSLIDELKSNIPSTFYTNAYLSLNSWLANFIPSKAKQRSECTTQEKSSLLIDPKIDTLM